MGVESIRLAPSLSNRTDVSNIRNLPGELKSDEPPTYVKEEPETFYFPDENERLLDRLLRFIQTNQKQEISARRIIAPERSSSTSDLSLQFLTGKSSHVKLRNALISEYSRNAQFFSHFIHWLICIYVSASNLSKEILEHLIEKILVILRDDRIEEIINTVFWITLGKEEHLLAQALELGFNPNISSLIVTLPGKTISQDFPLLCALRLENFSIAILLLEHGADPEFLLADIEKDKNNNLAFNYLKKLFYYVASDKKDDKSVSTNGRIHPFPSEAGSSVALGSIGTALLHNSTQVPQGIPARHPPKKAVNKAIIDPFSNPSPLRDGGKTEFELCNNAIGTEKTGSENTDTSKIRLMKMILEKLGKDNSKGFIILMGRLICEGEKFFITVLSECIKETKIEEVINLVYYVVSYGQDRVLEKILKIDFNPNILNRKENRYPLHTAVEKSNMFMVQTLIKFGANVDGQDTWGRTALAFAVSTGYSDIINYLLRQGANPNLGITRSLQSRSDFNFKAINEELNFLLAKNSLEMASAALTEFLHDRKIEVKHDIDLQSNKLNKAKNELYTLMYKNPLEIALEKHRSIHIIKLLLEHKALPSEDHPLYDEFKKIIDADQINEESIKNILKSENQKQIKELTIDFEKNELNKPSAEMTASSSLEGFNTMRGDTGRYTSISPSGLLKKRPLSDSKTLDDPRGLCDAKALKLF